MASGRISVVLVVDDLGLGGAERQVVELANNLDKDRFDIHVCSLENHTPLAKCLRVAEHKVHIIAMKNRFDFTIVPRLAYLLWTLQADIVHGFLFRAEIVARLAGRIAGTSLVVGSERNANRTSIKRSNVLAYKLTQRCIDIIVANSNAGAEYNRKLFRRSLVDYHVVHNGVDTERFRPMDGTTVRRKLGIPLRCPVVGAFANFKKQKNHSMLLQAFRIVLKSFPESRLLLVGDRPYKSGDDSRNYKDQLNHLVDDLKIRHRCIFLGHRKDAERLYPVCNVTVLSSLHEGTPNVLLESMACGVPVIATRVCDNDYIIREDEVGYLVAVGDEVGMAHCMKSLLNNKTLQQGMGRNARNWVLKEFSSSRLAEKMETVYTEFLSRKNRSHHLAKVFLRRQ